MTDKEQIIIDGIQFNEFGDFYVDYDLNGKFQSISSSTKEYKILKSLIKQLTRKTQECEKYEKRAVCFKDVNKQLGYKYLTIKQECENLKAEEKYLKQCCEKAGEELAKHSFEYDGKEKNLVVQAMELNEKYELLKIQNQQQYIEFKNKEINYEEQIRQLRLLNKELRGCLENDLTKLCVQKHEALNEIETNFLQA